MFQNFDALTDPSRGAARVAALREKLASLGVDGFLVPRADEHQGEYVATCSERLRWLTGFSGSAGMALILRHRALIFVDGRYTLQVRDQTDPAVFTYEDLVANPPSKWLEENGSGLKIGFDPWLHTTGETKALREALAKADCELVALAANPVDAIWNDRPPPPETPVVIHDLRFAGKLAREKLRDMTAALIAAKCDHAILTDPASLAWAFNIRGNDVPHTPLTLGFALVSAHGEPRIYLDDRKLDIEAKAYLTQLAILRPPAALVADVAELARGGATFGLDGALAAEKLRTLVEENGGKAVDAPDPARLPRACKNAVEIEGALASHRRDGAALCDFLAWFSAQPPGGVDEIAAAAKLEACRVAAGERLGHPVLDLSFDTISGAGPNGAIMHYRVSHLTNRTVRDGELFLVDSGAQYRDGTTDVTRTVIFGTPTDEMRRRYTLVLKGLIAISLARFPAGTRGIDIDAFARRALWAAGLDFAHGTGHGVGSYLSVHEGPQRIARTGTQVLKEGMILSNEPGFYKPGEYGIRLENLIVVTPATPVPDGEIDMHGFATLTLAPFDRRMIDAALLIREELAWLDAYHARVLAEAGPLALPDTRIWLEKACAPFERLTA